MILLGVLVAVVAVLALRDPSSNRSATGADTAGASASSASGASGAPGSAATQRTPTRRAPTPKSTDSPAGGSSAGSTPASGQSAPSGTADVKHTPLVVLNNTTTSGLASQAAMRFESGGWTVTSSGNLTNTILSTCAYYDPSVAGAQAAAQALMTQYPTIKRVKEKFDGLPAGPVVVVLTPDYSPN